MASRGFVLLVLAVTLATTITGESLVQQARQQLHQQLGPLQDAVIPSSMAGEIFFQILTYYAPVDSTSPRCRNDSSQYVEAALRNQLWALRMFDASSKLEPGALDGNFQGLGSYDACVGIDTPEKFIGQHCIVELLGLSVPAIRHLQTTEDDTLLPIQPLNPLMSVCVPSTCSYQDVEHHLKVAFDPLNMSVGLDHRSCSTRHPEQWEWKDYWAVCTICVILGLVVLTTFYDYFHYSNKKVRSRGLVSCFSLYKNLPKLSTRLDGNELSSINGLRFLAIVWIVIGHRYIIGFSVPNFGLIKPEEYLQHWSMAPVHSVMLAVEIFLLLSGLLVTYSFLKSTEDDKSFNLLRFYFHRYIRITPVYVLMILVDGVILYHLSDGPVWKRLTGPHRDICSQNWWTGLLYISNYYYTNSFRTCVPQTWYLSTDMQLYIFSPLLLLPLRKTPRVGLTLIFGCFLATISASFVNANYKELKAGGLITATRKTERNFDLEYTKTHLRSASYFMGLALGYFVYKHKQGLLKVNMTKPLLVAGWVVAAVLMVGTMFSIAVFQRVDYPGPQFVDSLYIAIYRPCFAVGVAWLVFVGVTGHGGAVNRMLSLPVMKSLATLTYGMYMTHLTFQTFEISRTRVPVDYTPFDLMVKCAADVAASVAAAAIVFLAVEAPFVEIDKWFFSKDHEDVETGNEVATLPVNVIEKTQL